MPPIFHKEGYPFRFDDAVEVTKDKNITFNFSWYTHFFPHDAPALYWTPPGVTAALICIQCVCGVINEHFSAVAS